MRKESKGLKNQETLFERPFVSRNMKIIKVSTTKFYEASAETPEAIMSDLENIFHRDKFYALTSGGGDSMSLTHWLFEHDLLEAGVHIKTNVGIQATTDFVIDFFKDHDWPLHVIEPSPKFTYAAHILQYGFPIPVYILRFFVEKWTTKPHGTV